MSEKKDGFLMRTKHWIITLVILASVSFGCMFTGFVMGDSDCAPCPPAAVCPPCPVPDGCPECVCPECPECPECPVAGETLKEIEVTRVVEVEREVEKLVTATPPTQSEIDQSTQQLRQALIQDIETVGGVNRVSLVQVEDGQIFVELFTHYSSQSYQPPISWEIVTMLAETFGNPSPKLTAILGDNFTFELVTYSDDNDYRYQSTTSAATFTNLYNRTISYDQWVTEAQAGF